MSPRFDLRAHRVRWGLIVVAAFVQTIVPRHAPAAEAPRESTSGGGPEPAAELFRKGLAEYDARRYRNAIEIFSRVYDETHSPALLFNIAQAWRLLGECSKAVAGYEEFVSADPTSPDVDRARDWLGKLRPCPEAGATAADVPETSARAATSQAASASASVASLPGQTIAVSAAGPSPAPAPGPRGRPVLVGILSGAAVVFAGTGAYAAWRANDLSAQVSAQYKNGGTWSGDAADVQRDGQRAQTEAIALLSAAALSGLAAYLVHRFVE
jgi:hypothetical protein